MISAERNDVNVNKLFHFGDWFEVNGQKVYIRLVGDTELNRARVFAIRKSAELRKKLNDKDSDEYFTFIPDELSDIPDISNGIISLSLTEFTKQAIKEATLPPLPSELKDDATLEEQEDYQAEIDDHPNKQNKAIQEYVNKLVQAEIDRLSRLSDSDVRKLYSQLIIKDLCENEMIKYFNEQCAWYGTFTDDSCLTRLFYSFESFSNLPSRSKTEILNKYDSLNIPGNELKK
jgi:hypothetical protein